MNEWMIPSQGSIFIEYANDFSLRGFEEGCSSNHIKTGNFMVVNALNVDLAVGFVDDMHI